MQAPKKTANVRDVKASASAAMGAEAAVRPDRAAIAAGRKPLDSKRSDTVALKAKAVELYGLPQAGLSAIPAIEANFKFAAEDSDQELNSLHVEWLLEEASKFLDRCHELRTRRDSLQLERWKLQLDLDRFFRLEQLQTRELQAGAETVPYERAILESAAAKSLEENHKGSEAQLKALLEDLVASGFNKRMSARELTQWLSSYPLKDRELAGDDAVYTFDGARTSKPDHLFEAARIEQDQAAWEQVHTLMAQRYAEMAESEAGRLRKESLDVDAQWQLANIGFRKERAQVVHDGWWERIFQSQSPNGLLNYTERIAVLENHFARDFREALARIAAAKSGMEQLFNYTAPLPQEGRAGYFDDVAAWSARARTRLAQITASEQVYVLALSVKDLTKAQWEPGRGAAQWTFDLPAELFPEQAEVRLRGISISVVAGKPEPLPAGAKQSSAQVKPEPVKPEGYWSARVSVPTSGVVKHVAGTSRELDQKSVSVCHLGHIGAHDTEFSGEHALHNASPIGKQWRLAMSPKSTGGTPTESLDDVHLFLRVAVRTQKAA
jgi:hypothetical protein